MKRLFRFLSWFLVGTCVYCLLCEFGWTLCRGISTFRYVQSISQPIELFYIIILSLLLKIAFGKSR